MVPSPPEITTHLRLIQNAYQQAFRDEDVLQSLLGKTAVLGIYFTEEDVWWYVRVDDGAPEWVEGQPDEPDVWVSYRNASTFHMQFHDPGQFMQDALQGAIEFHGNAVNAEVFQTMAVAFQSAYLALTG